MSMMAARFNLGKMWVALLSRGWPSRGFFSFVVLNVFSLLLFNSGICKGCRFLIMVLLCGVGLYFLTLGTCVQIRNRNLSLVFLHVVHLAPGSSNVG